MRDRSIGPVLLRVLAALLLPIGAHRAIALPPSGSAALEEAPFLATASDAGVKGNAGGSSPDLAASGTAVAFTSTSTNLDPDDLDAGPDVYVKEIVTGDVHVASTSDTGEAANDGSGSPAMSASGTFVSFNSNATNLDPGDADTLSDVYVKDLETGDIALASTSTAGVKGDSHSASSDLSGDGNRVAFNSAATNLHPADTDHMSDVFAKDLSSGTLFMVSRSSTGVAGVGLVYGAPSISRTGKYVAFAIDATNLDPLDTDSGPDVYVKRLKDRALFLASTSDSGVKGLGASNEATLSGNGTLVAFSSTAHNLDPADGDTTEDVFVKDILSGDIQLVSTSDTGVKGNGTSFNPAISGNGRWVAFTSSATNLDPNDTDPGIDIYVKDLRTGNLTLASTSAEGLKGDGRSYQPSISGKGQKVAFQSESTNLHPNDTDAGLDVYVKEPTGCTVVGTPGDDVLEGTPGEDVICGRGGNDTVHAGEADDVVYGEAGDDVLDGGHGADDLRGGGGIDTLDYATSTDVVAVDLGARTASSGHATGDVFRGFENLQGSEFPDWLAGDASGNTLTGLGGEDVLTGGADADVLDGGDGTDLIGYEHSPTAVTLDLATSTVSGGDATGDEIVDIEGAIGSAFADTLTGDGGDNTFIGLAGADALDGAGGTDLVNYVFSTEGVTVALNDQSGSGGHAEGDVILHFEIVSGTSFADSLTGKGGNETLYGLEGKDDLFGRGGDDTLVGAGGVDTFDGGDGTDTCDNTLSETADS